MTITAITFNKLNKLTIEELKAMFPVNVNKGSDSRGEVVVVGGNNIHQGECLLVTVEGESKTFSALDDEAVAELEDVDEVLDASKKKERKQSTKTVNQIEESVPKVTQGREAGQLSSEAARQPSSGKA